jgi:hypothetical protein
MRVRIVCYEDVDGWILGKFARRLCAHLIEQGVNADISKVPDASADINHHIIYINYDGEKNSTDTMMITHIDTDWKLELVRKQLVNAEMGICMSAGTYRQLVREGIPAHKLCYVSPAHDFVASPRKLLVGITSKVQESGCKREQMLLDLAGRISSNDFRFSVMGVGWSAIVEAMRERGVEVDYYESFDPEIYRNIMPTFDYYLYFGQDEGSMGFLDALNAGIPTIVTPQGFHLDVIDGITHPFNELHELVGIFEGIAKHRNRLVKAVAPWSWSEYALKHSLIWDYLLHAKTPTSLLKRPGKELRSMRVMRFTVYSKLQAAFYYGMKRLGQRFTRIRRRMRAMVRYRIGKHVRRHG